MQKKEEKITIHNNDVSQQALQDIIIAKHQHQQQHNHNNKNNNITTQQRHIKNYITTKV